MWHLLMPISVNLEVCLLKSFLVVSSSFFLSIFLSFSFFFWEETTTNLAGLQESIEKQIACYKNSSNFWTKFLYMSGASCYHTIKLKQGQHNAGTTHVTMIQSAVVRPIFNDTYRFLKQLKHEQPCKVAAEQWIQQRSYNVSFNIW